MKTIKNLKIAALVPVGLMSAILLLFGIGETLGGDLSGLAHLVPVVFAGLVIWLSWKRPVWGGILLLAGAIFEVVRFWGIVGDLRPMWYWPVVLLIAPLAISGLLMLTAGLLSRRFV